MRTISAILAAKGPAFNAIDASATVLDALSLMQCENLNYVVVTRGGRYAGLLTETDYARKVILMNRHSHNTRIAEIMTSDLPCVSGADSASHALLLMNLYQTRYLPVLDEFEFRGIIAINDLMQDVLQDKEAAAAGAAEPVLPQWDSKVRRRHQIH